jgi:type I restriction enzyme S subunit
MELESVPEGWELKSFGEVTDIIKGKKPKSIVNQKISGYMPYILIESFNKVYSKFTNELGCPQCNRDNIIMVMDGASSGLVAIGLEGVIGSTLAAIKPKDMID